MDTTDNNIVAEDGQSLWAKQDSTASAWL